MDKKLLLKTKVAPPILRADLISRKRLYEKLAASRSKTLILVTAPAGFGKTTLVNAWLRAEGLNFGWLSLDERDNDISVFSAYLAQVTSQVIEEFDGYILDKMRSPISDDHEAFIYSLINAVYENTGEVYIVLDDFHLIDSEKVQLAVEALVHHAPENLHIVITSRADPPMQLSRLRLENAVAEIRMDDLRFDSDETRALLTAVLNEDIDDDLAALLWKHTEGWAAGLLLAGLSMREKSDRRQFLENFSPEKTFIIDYFFDEVVSLLPEITKNFLFQSALFENFSAAFCDFTLERSDSAGQIDYLQKKNIFIFPMDEPEEWFRYHRLLRDLLSARSVNFTDIDRQALFSRASKWMEVHADNYYAVEYAIQAQDYTRAVALIENEMQDLLNSGHFKTLERWLSQIPQAFVSQQPALLLNQMWAQMITTYDYARAKEAITQLMQKYPDLHGLDDAINAFIAISEGNFIGGGELADRALEKLADKESYFYTIALWCAGISQATGRDLNKAAAIMQELYALSMNRKNYMIAVMTMSSLAKIHHRMGYFEKAEEGYQKALAAARDNRGNLLPIAGEALMGLGDLEREQGRFSEAEDDILEGIELTNEWRDVAAMEGYLALAKLRFGMDAHAAAFNALDKAMVLARKYDATEIDDRIIETQKAKFQFILGDMAPVHQWAEDCDYASVSPADSQKSEQYSNLLLSREFIFYARYLIEIGNLEMAGEWISVQIERFREMNKTDVLIELYLYNAYLAYLEKREKDTVSWLQDCLVLVDRAGFRRLVLDLDKKVLSLLERYRRSLPSSPFLDVLFMSYSGEEVPQPENEAMLIEPLSEREKDVLRYLKTNLTTPEIAEEMLIGVNTVRTHIKNIYAKLGVHKRSAAIRAAKNRKIIT